MQKDRFAVNIEKLKNMEFPQEYKSFNQLCYDLVLFDGQPCTAAQRTKLSEKSVNRHIKQQIERLARHTQEKGKRDERQIIHGLRDFHRELMEKELGDKENAEYEPYLTLLLKSMINEIYASKGVGKHVLRMYEIIDYAGFVGGEYSFLDDDTQDGWYAGMVADKLKNNIQNNVNRGMKKINEATSGLLVYKTGTQDDKPLKTSVGKMYDTIYETEKKNTLDYRRLPQKVGNRLNAELLALNPNHEHKEFYYNWIVEIKPTFEPFLIVADLKECRRELNESFILKLKKDVGYRALMDFSETYSYENIRTQIEVEVMNCCELPYEEHDRITTGYYIPEHLKKYLLIGKDGSHVYYYNFYNLGSYLYDISGIIKRAMIED